MISYASKTKTRTQQQQPWETATPSTRRSSYSAVSVFVAMLLTLLLLTATRYPSVVVVVVICNCRCTSGVKPKNLSHKHNYIFFSYSSGALCCANLSTYPTADCLGCSGKIGLCCLNAEFCCKVSVCHPLVVLNSAVLPLRVNLTVVVHQLIARCTVPSLLLSWACL